MSQVIKQEPQDYLHLLIDFFKANQKEQLVNFLIYLFNSKTINRPSKKFQILKQEIITIWDPVDGDIIKGLYVKWCKYYNVKLSRTDVERFYPYENRYSTDPSKTLSSSYRR